MTRHDPGYIYRKVKKNNKDKKTIVDLDLFSKIKDNILDILLENRIYWNCKNKIDQGISRDNLLVKLNNRVKKVSESFFSYALEDLIVEQKILFYELDGVVRYFYFEINK